MPTGRRPQESPRSRCADNIRNEINVRSWINSTRDWNYWKAFVNVALNLLVQ